MTEVGTAGVVRSKLPSGKANMTPEGRLNALTVRHQALARSLKLLQVEILDLKARAGLDGENIRALLRVAEARERRLRERSGGE